MPTDDYIKRSDALKAILGVSIYDTIEELDGARTIAENTWADGLYDAYKIIEEEVDAADVEPVRHGRWVRHGEGYDCSECKKWVDGDIHYSFEDRTPLLPVYCPFCGAKMDKEPPKGEENETDNL